MHTKPWPFALTILHFQFLLSLTLLLHFLPKLVAEKTDENNKFNDLLTLILGQHIKGGAEAQTMELPFARVAHVLKEIEKNFVEKLHEKCEDKRPQNWEQIFLSLHDNFQAINFDENNKQWKEVEGNTDLKVVAKRNAQLVQLLLSFVIQAGYTVGAQALKQKSDGRKGAWQIQLKRFVTVFNCIFWKYYVDRTYLSAKFVANYEEGILLIKFDSDNNTDNAEKKQRQFNFANISILVNQKCASPADLLDMIETIVELYDFTDNLINKTLMRKMDWLLLSWAGVRKPHYFDPDANVLYLLKSFGHGLARRLLESKELADGYFELYPHEKTELVDYTKELEANLLGFAKDAKLADSANREYAHFHYEDAICFDWAYCRHFIHIRTLWAGERELNLLTFNKRIRLFLARYVKDDDKETKDVLKRAKLSEEMAFKMHVSNAANFLLDMEKLFLTETMKAMCKMDNLKLDEVSEELAKLRQNFHMLTGGKLRMDAFRAGGKKLSVKDDIQVLQLLLSFVLQMGYTVGSRAMKLENDGQQLKQLLEMYSCLERIGMTNDPPMEKHIYLETQFLYIEGTESLDIKFELDSRLRDDNRAKRRKEQEDANANNTTKKAQRKFNFELIFFMMNHVCAPPRHLSYLIGEIVKQRLSSSRKLIKMDPMLWALAGVSNRRDFAKNGYEKNKNVVYLLSRFGHGLAQRLLESKELEDGYFQLYPQEKIRLEGYSKELEASLPGYFKDAKFMPNREYSHFHYEDVICFDCNTLESGELNTFTFKRIHAG